MKTTATISRYALGLMFTLVICMGQTAWGQSVTETFEESGTFIVPAGVSQVTVEVWGAGGGTSAPGNQNRRGGAGGGAYSRSVMEVTPGQSYSFVVGTGGTNEGTAGGDSYWVNIATLLAKGGSGNTGFTTANGGQATAGEGTVKYSGGTGAPGSANSGVSGGGGGGAGSTGNGKNASTNTAGGVTADFGGAGGNGVTSAGQGGNGENYGGGGGGSWRHGQEREGTSGADGFIRITYTCPTSAGTLSGIQEVCAGSTTTFISTVSGGTWSTNNSGIATVNLNTGVVTGVNAGTATITYTVDAGAGCTSVTATRDVTVLADNTISLTSGVGSNNQTVCVNSGITNIAYSTTGATGATFSGLPAGVSGLWASDQITISGTPTASGNFNYTVTLTGGCGNVQDGGTISVNALPQGTLAGNTICMGETGQLTFTATAGTGPFILIISGETYNGVVSGTPFNAIPNPTESTNYTLTSLTDNNSCVRTSDIAGASATITVNALPTASITSNNSPVCSGADAEFILTGTNGATVTYNINGGTNTTVTLSGGSATVAVTGATVDQTLNLVSVTDGTCSQNLNGSFTVTVNANPTASISPDPAEVVEGQQLQLDGNPTGGSGTYTTHLWTGAGATYLSELSIQNPVFNASEIGAFNLTYTVTDENGCTGTDDITVTVEAACANPTDGGTIAGAQTICEGGNPSPFTSTAAASGHSGTLEYKWQSSTTDSGSGFGDIAGATGLTYDAPAGLTQTTWYRRLARVNCSTDWDGAAVSNVLDVTVNPLPTFSFTSTDITCFGVGDGTITFSAIGGSGGHQYSINGGADWSEIPVFNNLEPDIEFTLVVKDSNGCIQTVCN